MITDRSDMRTPGRLLGVCAQLAETSGVRTGLLRFIAVLAMLCAFKLTVIVYCVAALAFRVRR